DGLTDHEATFTAERAAVVLEYTNGIPLGLDAQLEFVDEFGVVTAVLPDDADGLLRLDGAATGQDGFATLPTTSQLSIDVDEATLRALARSKDVRLRILFAGSGSPVSRIRATDRVDMALRGDFDINVSVGG
ncbi:MAG: hypothetical protein HKN13_04120, partial [Rhodothermales bacterium]|nr:hypothetical protein [Rhodothermales bacterium]